jgi:proteasome lid subunit RPN8/RPN11
MVLKKASAPSGLQPQPADAVCMPADTLQAHELFRLSDADELESMIFWFGPVSGGSTIEVTDLLRVDHVSGSTWVETVTTGEEQLETFAKNEPGKQLVGWAHSHHTLQGVPSVIDIMFHWRLGTNFNNVHLFLNAWFEWCA